MYCKPQYRPSLMYYKSPRLPISTTITNLNTDHV